MASSEPNSAQTESQSILERLVASRNTDLSLFLPFPLGLDGSFQPLSIPNPDDNASSPEPLPENGSDPRNQSDRVILINPFTQGMVVIEGASLRSLLRSNQGKSGQRPTSRASIESMPSVEITENVEGECVICLEEWRIGGGVVKEMPCRHRFHGDCINNWLRIQGSCPVCRFVMPCDEEDGRKKRDGDGAEREDADRRRWGGERGIWVSFTYGSARSSNTSSLGNFDQTVFSSDSPNDGSSLVQRTEDSEIDS